MPFCETNYISVGGNRQSAAADRSSSSGLVAFGADVNVALWRPQDLVQLGIQALLVGHANRVTAVRFATWRERNSETLLTGDGDGEIRLWQIPEAGARPVCLGPIEAHDGAVNAIASLDDSATFATGGADGMIKIWKVESGAVVLLHTIILKPRYIPLALALGRCSGEKKAQSLFLTVGGTKTNVQIFMVEQLNDQPRHELQATLTGHEGWVGSLSLSVVGNDFLLASASHDKYVRIWRIQQQLKKSGTDGDRAEKTLTRRIQRLQGAESTYSVVFEALLLGHEDWVHSASWSPKTKTRQLLTASADGSLAIWEPDEVSGIWVSKSRLGEISDQKGATTATGSAGGFWVGLWSLDGEKIMCLDRSGSWRLWQYEPSSDYWTAKPGVSGHVGSANDVSWAKGGEYLLSTGSDQTSRLHAEWNSGEKRSWHEFARPQIHGYDLNCITSVGSQRFVSGADEKLLRVFDEPKNVANMLHRLCGIDTDDQTNLPDAASMPVLGLSNKAADTHDLPKGHDGGDTESKEANPGSLTMPLDGEEPPTEDLLARHTLWPEHEKLYGHGYEISEVASNERGTLLATACKASSTDHAVIRLYDTLDWHEVKPPLVAHSLTVARLAFSCHPDKYLLSVGRDRQWTVFQQEDDKIDRWPIFQAFPKAHSRMILDAVWSTVAGKVFFATAGRDKLVKIWHLLEDGSKFELLQTITRRSAVTAISFTSSHDEKLGCLVVGEEDGLISFHVLGLEENLASQKSWDEAEYSTTKAVTRLQWRPSSGNDTKHAPTQLAVAAADGSIRVLSVDWVAALAKT